MRPNSGWIAGGVGAWCCLAAGNSSAFGISPFKSDLMPEGAGASQLFEFTNPTDEAQAVQISILRWTQDASGTEIDRPVDEVSGGAALQAYPDQFVLAAHGTQSVRVRWMGPQMLEREEAFRLVAEQLPVTFGVNAPGKKAVRFLVNYRAAVYVTPPRAQPDVVVTGFAPRVGTGGQHLLAITLLNRGAMHALLDKPVFKMTETDGHVMSVPGVDGVQGENIQAGQQRVVFVPWAEPLPPKGVTLDYKAAF